LGDFKNLGDTPKPLAGDESPAPLGYANRSFWMSGL